MDSRPSIEPALALLELDSIAVGIEAGDAMAKRAPIDVIRAGTVHPGKYLVLVGGAVADVEEALAAGRPALLEIDLQGARQVRETWPDALFVFLEPPNWEELVRRLVGRGTEDEVERTRRLDTARAELAAQAEFDKVIVNDDVRRASEELVSLMRSGHP
jgi:guanylate kinase